jgi:uncharacterized membrane protein
MHREELMSPDLLSEMVLLAFGAVILVSMVLFVMTITRAWAASNFPGALRELGSHVPTSIGREAFNATWIFNGWWARRAGRRVRLCGK